jgi:hypothetical protein
VEVEEETNSNAVNQFAAQAGQAYGGGGRGILNIKEDLQLVQVEQVLQV